MQKPPFGGFFVSLHVCKPGPERFFRLFLNHQYKKRAMERWEIHSMPNVCSIYRAGI